jgi:hypothetical protein
LAHKNKSLLLLFFRKEDSSFLKQRSKELLNLGPHQRRHRSRSGRSGLTPKRMVPA